MTSRVSLELHVVALRDHPVEIVLSARQALSFLFEYIGEMGKDYVYAVAPLLEDALMDRDLVHRQARPFDQSGAAAARGVSS